MEVLATSELLELDAHLASVHLPNVDFGHAPTKRLRTAPSRSSGIATSLAKRFSVLKAQGALWSSPAIAQASPQTLPVPGKAQSLNLHLTM